MSPRSAVWLLLAGCHHVHANAVEERQAEAVQRIEQPVPRRPGDTVLQFAPGSTHKVEQLVGDVDRETGRPTRTQSEERAGVRGADLGYSFEHAGRAWFLFGDTIGPKPGDSIASTTSTDGEELRLDFQLGADGGYLRVKPPGVAMGGWDVPVSGIDVGGKAYVVVKTDHTKEGDTDVSILTRFDEHSGQFTKLREISRRPDGKFLTMSMHAEPEPIPGLPDGGPWILVWGTGHYRASDPYLSIVPVATFPSGAGTRYYAGVDGGTPRWSDQEADAAPLFDHPTIGDLSVTWVQDLHLWLMLYDSRQPHAVVARYSATPWGPWSALQPIFSREEGERHFIHDPDSDDHLEGPMIGKEADPRAEHGGAYAPYVVERYTHVEGDKLVFYYVLSTWNPYVVVLMRTEMAIR